MPAFLYGTTTLSPGEEKRTYVSTDFDTLGHPLGTRAVTSDGRVFRLALAAEALTAGKLLQARSGVTNFDNRPVENAASIGAIDVQLLLGATTIGLDEYSGGYLYGRDGPGEGHIYRISSHPTVGQEVSTLVTFRLMEPIRSTDLTTVSEMGLVHNDYHNVLMFDVDNTLSRVVGVAPVDVANAAYFWCQTWGRTPILYSSDIAVGVVGNVAMPMQTTSTIAGAIGGPEFFATVLPVQTSTFASGATMSRDYPIIGQFDTFLATDTDHTLVFLMLSP